MIQPMYYSVQQHYTEVTAFRRLSNTCLGFDTKKYSLNSSDFRVREIPKVNSGYLKSPLEQKTQPMII